MGSKTTIAWSESTWNVSIGCTKVSPGCTHCYAEVMAGRLARRGMSEYGKVVKEPIGGNFQWNNKVELLQSALNLPKSWRKPRMIFVDSMSDLFHKDVPETFIQSVFDVMMKANWHIYQILTKRADRMAEIMSHAWWTGIPKDKRNHIWLGVSAETQKTAEERIPHLLTVDAAVRFLSVEPQLESVDLEAIPNALDGIHQVICGGESQFGCRDYDIGWGRDLRDQCSRAGVRFFMKQLGGFPYKRDQLKDFPEDLQIRQFPELLETLRPVTQKVVLVQNEFPFS